jgi:hypothetical protein
MKEDYDLEDQGDLANYLGLEIKKDHNGNFTITQPHLIQKILVTAGLDGATLLTLSRLPLPESFTSSLLAS